ncbi:MAG: hypothetical protein IJ740_08355 [Ruminococcus sp.]|nr:hypothetical protein [Ruminococcus sp.]
MLHEVKILIPGETTDPELKALYDEYNRLAEQLGQSPLSWDNWYTNMLLFGSKWHVGDNANLFNHNLIAQIAKEV